MPRYMFEKSRYGQARFLDVTEDYKAALLHGESRYFRAGQSPEGGDLMFVDLEGGPFVGVGDTISVQDGKSKVVLEITSLSIVQDSELASNYVRINLGLKKAKSQKEKANWNTILLPPGR